MKIKRSKLNIQNMAIILIFLVGLGILSYPTISNLWNRYRDSKLISTYDQTVNNISTETAKKDIEAARAYNMKLIGSAVPDAFSIRENTQDKEYESLLNINGEGMMGYIIIPSVDIELPLYHYTTDEVLEQNVGHLAGSSLPVGGESTHTVVSAHRGLPSAKLFTDLNLLKNGDVFYVKVYDDTLAYEVDQILTVEPDETQSLSVTRGKDLMTLVTCTPYAVNTHRLLVRGHRIEYKEEVLKEALNHPGSSLAFPWQMILCVISGILLAVVFGIVINRKEVKKWVRERKQKKEKK